MRNGLTCLIIHSLSKPSICQACAEEETISPVNLRPSDPPRTPYAAASDTGHRAFCWTEHFSGVKRPPLSLAPQNHLKPLV